MENFLATAVIGRDRKVNSAVVCSRLCGGLNLTLEGGWELAQITNKANAYPLSLHFGEFRAQDPFKQHQQKLDLRLGPTPVFGRKGIGG